MSYRLSDKESLQNGIRRVISEQIERALAELADERMERSHVIHQVRKRCKKIRGALRLVRHGTEVYGAENARYRDAARRVSELRDADVEEAMPAVGRPRRPLPPCRIPRRSTSGASGSNTTAAICAC